MNSRHLWMLLTTTLLVLPRAPFTYAAYGIGSILLFDFRLSILLKACCYGVWLAGIYCLLVFLGYELSPASFLIAMVFHAPIILVMAGSRFSLKKISPVVCIRVINLLVCVLSLLSMWLYFDFPRALPYIDYLPDAYAAFFGNGGAKIITVIGFFGLAFELHRGSAFSLLKGIFILVALLNFLAPSYLIGTVCGLFALAFPNFKRKRFLVLVFVAGGLLMNYLMYRFETINSDFMDTYGFHPKVGAYVSVADLFVNEPITVLTGTGIGQFTSTAAEWSSDYIGISNTRADIVIPGLYQSFFHEVYLGKYLDEVMDNPWAINSSANKPYTSFSSILAEFGVPLGLFMLYCYFKLIIGKDYRNKERLTLAAFVFSLFALEVWHDNFWFMYMLLLSTAALATKAPKSKEHDFLELSTSNFLLAKANP